MRAVGRYRRTVGALTLIAATALGALAFPKLALAATIQSESAMPHIDGATLEAAIDPDGEDIECAVEYKRLPDFEADGWTGAETITCSPEAIGAAEAVTDVQASLVGLERDQRYRYRFVATTPTTTTVGPGGTFHTFGVEEFNVAAVDQSGEPGIDAGIPPHELVTRLVVSYGELAGVLGPAGFVKDVMVELPPGLIGNPTAVPRCPVRLAEQEQKCPGESQVGMIKVVSASERSGFDPNDGFRGRLYNVETGKGEAARIAGLINLSTNAYISAGVRTGADYGVNAGASNLPTLSSPFDFEIRIWGVPADPSHDPERRCPGVVGPCSLPPETAKRPFLRNPTRCGELLRARVKVESYNLPGVYFTREVDLPPITGCDQVPFDPSLTLRPTTEVADSPTGLHVNLEVPQHEDPAKPASADLRDAVVRLPDGLTVNPASAQGLAACTPQQFGLTSQIGASPVQTTAGPATCPDAAKIGTVEIDSPLLDHTLRGGVYVAEPYNNPFGSLLAIYIAVDDAESGIVIKLAGEVAIDSDGRLTAMFKENPQLPFESFRLNFFGGPRAALKTPTVCGSFEVQAALTPWSASQAATPEVVDSFDIGAPPSGGSCPRSHAGRPADATLQAGSDGTLAGAFTPFGARVSRQDGSQELVSISVTPPKGLLARLAGVPYCPDSALAAAAARSGSDERHAPSCPKASEVGSVVVGAGVGPDPIHVVGKAYLAGPYKGAPLSLAFVTPAVAGPYDLGTVVVRAALEVDPVTAQVTVNSDPIPTQLKGVQLALKTVDVKMDRDRFTLNPTNCEATNVRGTVVSRSGAAIPLQARFQVGGCRQLSFKPKIALRVSGPTRRAGHPALKAVVRFPTGARSANIARAQVGLPPAHMLDQGNIRSVCTQAQLHTRSCPKGSIYGWAKAWTPLLEEPLEGPVYLGVGYGHKLPDLVADLDGQVRILLNGRIDTTKRLGLRSTFQAVPDAPVSRFVLRMKGGKRYGLLTNKENICRKPQRASVRFIGQNGKVAQLRPLVANDCGRAKKKARRR